MPKLKHIYVNEYPYFVTANTIGKDIFSNTKLADLLLSCIYYGKNERWYLLLSFVIMPDHMHIIVVPKSKNISQIMKSLKGYSARMINLIRRDNLPAGQAGNVPPIQEWKNASSIQQGANVLSVQKISSQQQDRQGFLTLPQVIWQEGFYDYILDSEDKLWTKIKYIEDNPVRKRLVLDPELYPYSSAYKQNLTDLDIYLNDDMAGQECPAYPLK